MSDIIIKKVSTGDDDSYNASIKNYRVEITALGDTPKLALQNLMDKLEDGKNYLSRLRSLKRIE